MNKKAYQEYLELKRQYSEMNKKYMARISRIAESLTPPKYEFVNVGEVKFFEDEFSIEVVFSWPAQPETFTLPVFLLDASNEDVDAWCAGYIQASLPCSK